MASTVTGTVTNGISIGSGTYSSPLTIAPGATVSIGSGYAVYSSGRATIVDYGTVSATAANSRGVVLEDGGYVTLGVAGLVESAHYGIYISGAAGTVTDAGTIEGTGIGIELADGGTVVDSGTISGATAIVFGGTGNNLLGLDPGYNISGSIIAGGSAGNRLELLSNSALGTISGLGSIFTGFATVTVDTGAQWTLAGGNMVSAGVALEDLGTLTADTLTNHGSIVATGAFIIDPGTLVNEGEINGTVTLEAGSYLDNTNTGTIVNSASAGIAVYGSGGPVSVTNAGTILATGSYGTAVTLGGAGGHLHNTGTIAATGYKGVAVSLADGGSVFNDGSGADILGAYTGVGIYGTAGTVTNTGTILGTGTLGVGVVLDNGSIGNSAGNALIEGYLQGILALGSGVTVTNSGTIEATGYYGAAVALGGTGAYLRNTGTVAATNYAGVGVSLADGGSVFNDGSAAYIAGAYTGVGIYRTAGTVTNTGTIEATGALGIGIVLDNGSVENSAGGALIGGYLDGILVMDGAGTVTNSGTIEGTGTSGTYGVAIGLDDGGTVIDSGTIVGGGTAILFGGTGSNLLELDPGYRILGQVYAAIAAQNTIELLGRTAATLAGIGSEFVGFQTIAVAAGASWQLTGSFSGRLDNAGVLLPEPFSTFYFNGKAVNTGTIEAPFYLQRGGYLTNAGTGVISGNATSASVALYDSGTVVNSGTIENAGANAVDLGSAGVFTNASHGLIEGYSGVSGNFGVTVVNKGTIEGTASAGYGIVSQRGGTVTNYRLIEAGASGGRGVLLKLGGYVDNKAGGTIDGYAYAVRIAGTVGSVTNSGTIEAIATGGNGLELDAGGTIDNSGGTALIEGYSNGVLATGAAVTVTNSGTIDAIGTNGIGVDLVAGGTVIDSGMIGGAVAVYFGGAHSNLLELEAGYKLAGSIVGSGGANTLELSGTLGAVSASYNSLGLIDFQYVAFAAPTGGHDETLVITDTAALPGTIEGFTAFHDIIDLRQLTADPADAVISFDTATDRLTVTEGMQSVTLQLAGDLDGVVWQAGTDGHGGTDIEPACFVRGTRILTENGDCKVEDLAIGDRVVTYSGARRTIKWIGRRAYKGAFVRRNGDTWPILVQRGALGPDLPRRDLYLSGRHALYFDDPLSNPPPRAAEGTGGGGLLIPVERLVNGRSIIRCHCPDEVEYFHIELDTHDVIFAEGAPAETFVDCGDRKIFHNACEFALLYPGEEPARWAFCAPRIEAGRDLDRVRARLLARAGRRAAA